MACLFVFPQWVGSPCGLHGPYIFYKAFRFHLEGKARILSLGDFFLVRCKAGDPICIAELQLLWEERTTKQLLSSSKLYFLPEDTPQGRNVTHGEVMSHVFPAFFSLSPWRAPSPSRCVFIVLCMKYESRAALHRIYSAVWDHKTSNASRLIIDAQSQERTLVLISPVRSFAYERLAHASQAACGDENDAIVWSCHISVLLVSSDIQ